ncbi:MAG: orotate phosphoribosyltransferase [Ramalina farinacea]|uniref:Orotate phosphoribosyltransferase n=1 Tax=Ramalina farinacea TaxID=258253 RepID=A0AA43TVH8_9LECA|nr:orotate phosphoribosyltransferase [Ramalina farinacea]
MAQLPPSTAPTIPAYKTAFLQACLSANVLTFGTYTLKSGRQSPYFFNAGAFHTAPLLSAISTAYAHTIIAFLAENPDIPQPDVIFGPAYKGIPLATTTLLALHTLAPDSWSRTSYTFNRKEAKNHGETGSLVGSPLANKNILVIDDVITAGTAMRETIELVKKEGGRVVGFVVAVDRGERISEGESQSAMGLIRREFGVRTARIVGLDDLIGVVRAEGGGLEGEAERMERYRERWRASD